MRPAAPPTEVRDRLLDAAERLLGRYGYRKSTVDDLASEAGVGKGTVYLHFPSREEVFLATVDRIVDRLTTRQLEIIHRPAPATERLRDMLLTRVLFRFDSVQSYASGIDGLVSTLRPAFLLRRERYFDEEGALFAAVLQEGLEQNELELEDPRSVAHTLLLATNALLPYNLNQLELEDRAELELKTAQVADLLIRGLVRRPLRPAVSTVPVADDGTVP